MRIKSISALSHPIYSKIANAYVDFSQMTGTVCAVRCELPNGKSVMGYGFNSMGRYTAESLMKERFIPRLMEAEESSLIDPVSGLLCPFKCWSSMMRNEKPGGHGERSVAVGTLDMALWDVVAKASGQPLWRLLSQRYNSGHADSHVDVYAAGGYYYPGKGVAHLQDEMRSYFDRGYLHVKMKVGGSPKAGQAYDIQAALQEDSERIEGVLKVLPPNGKLAVDANGRLDLEGAKRYADMLQRYEEHILWYEEAGDPLDYQLQANLSQYAKSIGSSLSMATGENLLSAVDARNLLRHGGMDRERDILQFDCALSYGLVEYMKTLDYMAEEGWSRRRVKPHGGHQMSLNMAAGLQLGGNESYPDVFQPFNGFADHSPVVDGRIAMDDTPGVGFEANSTLFEVMRKADLL